MSADNGVYILETKGPEYRVKYAHNIDSIYGQFDDKTGHWKGDQTAIKEVFGSEKPFTELNQALDKAQEISYGYSYLEDGICQIDDFKNLEFNSLE